MKVYTSDKELDSLIVSMRMSRQESTDWEAIDEQLLAFLEELRIRRKTEIEYKISQESSEKYLSTLMDRMQDEKGLLIQ